MALIYLASSDGNCFIVGLSTDTKPSSPPSGFSFLEADTGTSYKANGGSWVISTNSTPSISGNALKFVRVNAGETGLEFVASAGGASWGSITGTLSAQTDLQSALDAKLATNGNGSALTGLTKTQVGLANVDNTSDANKPVSSATQTALDLKANLASPTFTGTPTLPTGTIGVTQSPATNNTTLATTAFVTTADNLKANLASPTFTGTVTLPASQVVNGVTLSTAQGTGNFLRGDGTYAAPTAALPNLIVTALAPSENQTIATGFGAYIPDSYEVVNTFSIEISNNSILEIG